jgi:hypothetical protein
VAYAELFRYLASDWPVGDDVQQVGRHFPFRENPILFQFELRETRNAATGTVLKDDTGFSSGEFNDFLNLKGRVERNPIDHRSTIAAMAFFIVFLAKSPTEKFVGQPTPRLQEEEAIATQNSKARNGSLVFDNFFIEMLDLRYVHSIWLKIKDLVESKKLFGL